MPFKNIEDYKRYQKKYQKEFYLKNKENIKERDKLYRLNNKDKIKEIGKLYRLNNKDKVKKAKLLSNLKYPVQIIFAGKPYPVDHPAISQFNHLVNLSKNYKNVAVLVGYELALSKRMKQASDVWLNNPRVPREASGTSGMTAAMNGAVNFSTDDGWIPEFVNHGNNGFVVPKADYANMSTEAQDEYDLNEMYKILEEQIVPMYYDQKDTWRQITQNGMKDVRFQFDSNRMADEYYEKMYKI
jgi:starch phosphorylase